MCNIGSFLLCQSYGNALPLGSCRVNSISAEGIPDPFQLRKLGCLPWEDYTSQRSQGKSKNPLALTATATSLSASPACLGAGSWELDYGGLSSRRSRRSRESLSVAKLQSPPERPRKLRARIGMPAPPSPARGPIPPLRLAAALQM